MNFTNEFFASCNAHMKGGGGLFMLGELDQSNASAWTVGDLLFAATKIEKTDLAGDKKSIKITPDMLLNNEKLAAVLSQYCVEVSSTEDVKYTLENNIDWTMESGGSGGDTSKYLYCVAHFGVAGGKRQVFHGIVQIEAAESYGLSTSGNQATRRKISIKFVTVPVAVTLPARDSKYFPQLASSDPGYFGVPKMYSTTTTNDSTVLPFVSEIAANTYSGTEMWLGV